jgi:YHS domain-containing protein
MAPALERILTMPSLPSQKPLPSQRLLRTAALTLILLLGAGALLAANPVNRSLFGKVAIHGYDPVAYFEQEAAVEGSKDHTVEWQGAVWRFASEESRAKFTADPEKYAPQYGGYCAYAVANGSTADVDPEAWSVIDGKLYLNYNAKIRQQWLDDTAGYIEKADRNWPKLRNSD